MMAVELREIAAALLIRQVSAGKAIACHVPEVLIAQPERSLDCSIVDVDIAAEIGRIIRIDGDAKACLMEPAHVVGRHIRKHPQRNVRAWAHRKRRLPFDKLANEISVRFAAHAVIDAVNLQDVDGLSHVVCAALFARMSDRAPTVIVARRRERATEF